jgi:hypothetical protein
VSELAAHNPAPAHRTLRDIADELLEYQRVEYIDDGRPTFAAMPGFTHAKIVRMITRTIDSMWSTKMTSMEWDIRSENFQLERVDEPQKFFVPDIAVAYPGYQVHSSGKYGMPVKLPEPFEFAIPTGEWPPYSEDD